MRLMIGLCFSVAVALSAPDGGQEDRNGTRATMPKKGDTLTVKGCLRGSVLESTETADSTGATLLVPSYAYQLKGKKDLLKELRGRHDDSLVTLKGELKTALDESRGMQVGRTRIVVGADPMSRGRSPVETGQIQPVLEVKSFEGSGVSCRR